MSTPPSIEILSLPCLERKPGSEKFLAPRASAWQLEEPSKPVPHQTQDALSGDCLDYDNAIIELRVFGLFAPRENGR